MRPYDGPKKLIRIGRSTKLTRQKTTFENSISDKMKILYTLEFVHQNIINLTDKMVINFSKDQTDETYITLSDDMTK